MMRFSYHEASKSLNSDKTYDVDSHANVENTVDQTAIEYIAPEEVQLSKGLNVLIAEYLDRGKLDTYVAPRSTPVAGRFT